MKSRRDLFLIETKGAAVAPVPAADRRATPRPEMKRIVVPFEVKADSIDESERTFEGLASVWGLDLGDDVMHKGAFKKTISEWKNGDDSIPLLNSHNHYDVLSAFGQLIDAKETTEGLWTKWEVIEGADGDRVLARLRPSARTGKSAVSKMSIGYEPTKFNFEESDDARFGQVRNLLEVRLKEVSLVLFPMAPGARINVGSVKTMIEAATSIDPKDVDSETKAELRKLASRIGILLAPQQGKTGTSTDEPEPTATPKTPPAKPAVASGANAETSSDSESGEPGTKDEDAYLYSEALQQRLLSLRLSSVSNSTGQVQ